VQFLDRSQCFHTLTRSLLHYLCVGSYGNHVIWETWAQCFQIHKAANTCSQEVGLRRWVLHHPWAFTMTVRWYNSLLSKEMDTSTTALHCLSSLLFNLLIKIMLDPLLSMTSCCVHLPHRHCSRCFIVRKLQSSSGSIGLFLWGHLSIAVQIKGSKKMSFHQG
jgi:hypothetical protein